MKQDYSPILGIIVIFAVLIGSLVGIRSWVAEKTESSEAIIAEKQKNAEQFAQLERVVSQLERDRPRLERYSSEWASATNISDSVQADSLLTNSSVRNTVSISGDQNSSQERPFRSRMLRVESMGRTVTGTFANVINYLNEITESMPQARLEKITMSYVSGETVTSEFLLSLPEISAFDESDSI